MNKTEWTQPYRAGTPLGIQARADREFWRVVRQAAKEIYKEAYEAAIEAGVDPGDAVELATDAAIYERIL